MRRGRAMYWRLLRGREQKNQRQFKTKNIQIVERPRQPDCLVIMLQAPCTGFRSISNSKTLWTRSALSGNDGAIKPLLKGSMKNLSYFFGHPLSLTISSITTASSTTDKMDNTFITEQQTLLSKEVLLCFDPTFTKAASTNNFEGI